MTKQTKIKTISFVQVGNRLVCTDDLNKEQRKYVATWIKTTYLNSLFQGKANFFPKTK